MPGRKRRIILWQVLTDSTESTFYTNDIAAGVKTLGEGLRL